MSGDRVNVRLWKYCWGGEEPFCSSFIVDLDCPVCGILRLMDWDCGFQRNLNEEERREGKSVVVRKTILFWKFRPKKNTVLEKQSKCETAALFTLCFVMYVHNSNY